MSSMTMHGVETVLDQRLREEASSLGLSLNQTLKKLLSKSVGLDRAVTNHRHDYAEFFGVWTKEDEADFNESISSCRQVDPEDWA